MATPAPKKSNHSHRTLSLLNQREVQTLQISIIYRDIAVQKRLVLEEPQEVRKVTFESTQKHIHKTFLKCQEIDLYHKDQIQRELEKLIRIDLETALEKAADVELKGKAVIPRDKLDELIESGFKYTTGKPEQINVYYDYFEYVKTNQFLATNPRRKNLSAVKSNEELGIKVSMKMRELNLDRFRNCRIYLRKIMKKIEQLKREKGLPV